MEPLEISQPSEPDPLGYPAAFGLLDNPFNPQEFDGVSGTMLDGLFEIPLAIDEEPRLEPLFVAAAGPFQRHVDTFKNTLRAEGYRSGENPSRTHKSFVFRVFGPKGSGKSTMTNKMVGWLKGCFTEEQMAQRELRVVKCSVSPAQVDSALKGIRDETADHNGGWCCLVLEDVNLDTEELLHDLYDELRNGGVAVVMFEILHSAEALRRIMPDARVGLRDLRTTGLSRDQARAFLAERIRTFRDDTVAMRLNPHLATYPFDPDQVGEVVGHDAALTLRTLNRVLHQALIRELERRTLADDIARLSDAELRSHLIDIVAVYDELFALEDAA